MLGLAALRNLMTSGMGHSFANQALVSGFSFAVGIGTARILGIEEFGLFSLIYLMGQFLAMAEAHLISTPMMTLSGAKPKLSKNYYGSLFAWAVCLAVASGVIMATMVAAYFAVKSQATPPWLIATAAFYVLTQNIQGHIGRILFARKSYVAGVLLEFIRPVVLVLLALFWMAAGFGASLPALLLLLTLSALVSIVFAIVRYIDVAADWRMMKALVRRHWPLSRWFLLVWLVSIGQEQGIWVMVGIQIGDAGAGALRAAQYLLGMTQVLVLSLENFLPRNAAEKLKQGSPAALGAYLVSQLTIIGGLSTVIIAFLVVYAGEILGLVFGPEFAQHAMLLKLFCVVYFIVLIRSMIVHYLRAVEDARAIFIAFLTSSVVAILTIYPLLSTFGLEGAIYCMMLAQFVCLASAVFSALRHFSASSPPAPVTRKQRQTG